MGAKLTFGGDIQQKLDQLGRNVLGKALRPAAHAAALVMYQELQQRVPVRDGVLRTAIYRWHDDKRSTDDKQVYVVGINKKKAKHWHNVEYGHWRVNAFALIGGRWVPTRKRLASPVWVPAHPYLRPAVDAKLAQALEAGKQRLSEKLRELL